MKPRFVCPILAAILSWGAVVPAIAQTRPANGTAASSLMPAAPLPSDYVIGAEDVLSIVFWRDKDMSQDVVVRPDGRISLPLINDIQAAGYTPDQLRALLIEAASKYIEGPNATVVVKEINSRKVFITGSISKPGTYTLIGPMNVLQLIALAGGLAEYADAKNILVIRTEGGKSQSFKFNYKDVARQKNLQQNIALRPGDTVIVP